MNHEQERAEKLFNEGWKPMGYLMIYHPSKGSANLSSDEVEVYRMLVGMNTRSVNLTIPKHIRMLAAKNWISELQSIRVRIHDVYPTLAKDLDGIIHQLEITL